MLWRGWPHSRLSDPWSRLSSDFERLSEEMNRMLGRAEPTWAPDFPSVNVWLGEDRATITSELPGLDPKDIEVSAVGETVTFKGNRKPEEAGKDEVLHRQERRFGQFSRTVTLPFRLDANDVKARFRNGVLHVDVMRAESDRPRKISVKSE